MSKTSVVDFGFPSREECLFLAWVELETSNILSRDVFLLGLECWPAVSPPTRKERIGLMITGQL